MADFKLRLSDDLAARFDAWAADRGGRSPALRGVIAAACETTSATGEPLGARPVKLTVRLSRRDAIGLDGAAADVGLTRNAWAAAVLRRRLGAGPTFPREQEVSLLAIQIELRRIGSNVNQIARALNTAVLVEGRVLELEIAYLDDLRRELKQHLAAVREAFAGTLAYWDGEA